jgi:monosaccharide-transporting ATPase
VPGAGLLSLRGVEKRYPGVRALRGVDFDVARGEVHALVGENGAGKSTLVRLATGVERADSGTIEFDGRVCAFRSPLDAQRAGIATIHQELTRIPELSVAENVCLGREPRRWYGIDWSELRAHARAALLRVGLDVDVTRPIGSLSVAEQQMVAIARALDLDAELLVLDEPTASLDRREVEQLFARLGELRSRGISIVFIGHRLDEVFRIADRITVLRGGERVGTFRRDEVTRVELVARMLASEPGEPGEPGPNLSFPGKRFTGEPFIGAPLRSDLLLAPPVLEARGLARAGVLEPCDLTLRAGEIVGLAGLLGSGRSELAALVFGALSRTAGSVRARGRELRAGSVRDAIDAGLAYAPEERGRDGLVPDLSVRENILLVVERRFGPLSRERGRAVAKALVVRLKIACADLEQPVRTLSGGNQQKVILARWLAAGPSLFVLDEPTRGIDVGAKAEIEREVRALADRGLSVLFISSALEEVLRDSDRVIVMRERGKVLELEGDAIREEAVLAAMAGSPSASAPGASSPGASPAGGRDHP